MSEETETDIKVRDLTVFANRRDSDTACLAVCDESQVLILANEVEQAARLEETLVRRHLLEDFERRFPNAELTTLISYFDKSPQPYDDLRRVPMNLLTESEIASLGLKKFAPSDHVLLSNRGATVDQLFWAIVAPHAGLAHVVNPTPKQQVRFLKQMIRLRDDQERERLAVIWSKLGLPAFKPRAKVQDIRDCLWRIERLIG